MSKSYVRDLSPEFTGAQRRQLRALAHDYKPVVLVGHGGVSPSLIDALAQALYDHELVKVKVLNNFEGEIEDVAQDLAIGTNSALVQKLGRILLFYRQNPDDPKIVLVKDKQKTSTEKD
ncbi:MAG: YhbY family RNA-binding protein [Bradymonadia bacterium]|jgi:RNA-binding protein